jgi:hypothetical protein
MPEGEQNASRDGSSTLPDLDNVRAFLADYFGVVDDVKTLQRGGWSSAFSFRSDRRELILRLGPKWLLC